MGVPGTAVVAPSSLVTDRSAVGVRVSLSVALLCPGASVTPPGAVTVAVLLRVPVADGLMAAGTVSVSLHAALRFLSLMLPVLPLAVKPLAPPVCVAV